MSWSTAREQEQWTSKTCRALSVADAIVHVRPARLRHISGTLKFSHQRTPLTSVKPAQAVAQRGSLLGKARC